MLLRLMSGSLAHEREGSHISIVMRETRAEPPNGDRHGHVTDRQGGDIFFLSRAQVSDCDGWHA
jgi:hypothetical protein